MSAIKAELEGEDRRTPMPKKVYHLLRPAAIKELCIAVGLPVAGTKEQLIRRHKEFVERYNAQCDSARPMSRQEIVDAVMRDEAGTRKRALVTDPDRGAEAAAAPLAVGSSTASSLNSFEALKREIENRKKQKVGEGGTGKTAPEPEQAPPAPRPLKRELSHISLSDSDQPIAAPPASKRGSSAAQNTPRTASCLNDPPPPSPLKIFGDEQAATLEVQGSQSQPGLEDEPSSQRSQRSQRTRRSGRTAGKT